MITGRTRVVCLIGNPVGHSLSPHMHNAGFCAVKADMVYVACPVDRDVAGAVQGIRALGMRGANVTVPHKERCAEVIDEACPDVKATGAVNTIVNDGGRLYGYNTDVSGLIMGVKNAGGVVDGPALIIGAGGAARSAVWALGRLGIHQFVIANRDKARAEMLIKDLGTRGHAVDFDLGVGVWATECGVIVNATSVGADVEQQGSDVVAAAVNGAVAGTVVVNYAYRAGKVYVDELAREKGFRLVCGKELLLWQGAGSFELWTGRSAPVDVMRDAIWG